MQNDPIINFINDLQKITIVLAIILCILLAISIIGCIYQQIMNIIY